MVNTNAFVTEDCCDRCVGNAYKVRREQYGDTSSWKLLYLISGISRGIPSRMGLTQVLCPREVICCPVVIDPKGYTTTGLSWQRRGTVNACVVWLWIIRCQMGAESYPRPLETSRSWKEIAELKERLNSYWTNVSKLSVVWMFRHTSLGTSLNGWFSTSFQLFHQSSSNVAVGW